MSKPLRVCFSNSFFSSMWFAHQCHSNGTWHFPGIIEYSHNVARWPVGPTVTLLRETEMGPQDKGLPSAVFIPIFRKATGHAKQDTHEPMRNFDMKWWILEKWFNQSGCKHLICMIYVVIVIQKQSHMPQDSKCTPNFLLSWYKNSNNNLFKDNGKTFISWPNSVQSISSS